jgi:hypothetical protein
MFIHLEEWPGKFDEKSVGATVYSFTMLNLFQNLLIRQVDGDVDKRMKIIDNYGFVDFFRRLVAEIENDSANSKFNDLCADAFPEY